MLKNSNLFGNNKEEVSPTNVTEESVIKIVEEFESKVISLVGNSAQLYVSTSPLYQNFSISDKSLDKKLNEMYLEAKELKHKTITELIMSNLEQKHFDISQKVKDLLSPYIDKQIEVSDTSNPSNQEKMNYVFASLVVAAHLKDYSDLAVKYLSGEQQSTSAIELLDDALYSNSKNEFEAKLISLMK